MRISFVILKIDPVAALALKRQIDASNQDRTDMVEYIDSYFLDKNKDVAAKLRMQQSTQRALLGGLTGSPFWP